MSANETQVGGSHYKRDFQHWDLMVLVRAAYLPGQVTRYTERHDKKNGREDLEKALHVAEKMHETSRLASATHSPRALADLEEKWGEHVRNYAIRAGLTAIQERIFEYALLRPHQTSTLVSLCRMHLASAYPERNPEPARPGTPEDGGQHATDLPDREVLSVTIKRAIEETDAAIENSMNELEDAIRGSYSR